MARSRRHAAAVLGAAAGIAAAVIVARRVDWSALADLSAASAWALVVVAALCHLGTVPMKALAWRCTLSSALPGSPRVPVRVLVSPVVVGATLNLTLVGRVGEAARVVLAHSRLRRAAIPAPMPAVVGSAVTESLVSTVTWVGLVAVAGLVLPIPGSVWIALGVISGLWGLVVVASALRSRRVDPVTVPGRFARRLVMSLARVWDSVAHGHRALGRPAVLVPLVAASLVGWAAQLAGTWALLAALGIEGGWKASVLVTVALSIAQTLPLLPGNVGVFQAAAALPLIASFGVSPEMALAFGVLLQLVQTAPVALLGVVALARSGESVRGILRSSRGAPAGAPAPA